MVDVGTRLHDGTTMREVGEFLIGTAVSLVSTQIQLCYLALEPPALSEPLPSGLRTSN
jgi:hypothetical protein